MQPAFWILWQSVKNKNCLTPSHSNICICRRSYSLSWTHCSMVFCRNPSWQGCNLTSSLMTISFTTSTKKFTTMHLCSPNQIYLIRQLIHCCKDYPKVNRISWWILIVNSFCLRCRTSSAAIYCVNSSQQFMQMGRQPRFITFWEPMWATTPSL